MDLCFGGINDLLGKTESLDLGYQPETRVISYLTLGDIISIIGVV